MRFREKVLILFLAVSVSIFGFNLIATPSVCLLKVAKESGYEPIQSYLVKYDANYNQSEYSVQKASNFTKPNTCLQSPDLKASLLEERGDYSLKKTLKNNESVSSF